MTHKKSHHYLDIWSHFYVNSFGDHHNLGFLYYISSKDNILFPRLVFKSVYLKSLKTPNQVTRVTSIADLFTCNSEKYINQNYATFSKNVPKLKILKMSHVF